MAPKIKKIFKRIKAAIKLITGKFYSAGSGVGRIVKKVFTQSVRRKFAKVLVAITLLLLAIETVFAVLIYGFHRDDKTTRAVASVVPYPVAIVNQDVITYKSYLEERDYIHHFYASTKQENVNLSEVDKQILDQLIDNRLIAYQASVNGIKIKNDEINQTLQSVIEQNGGEEKVGKVLSDLYGLDLNSFRGLIKNQLIRDKINQDLIMRVKARHILVRVDQDAPQDKVDVAKKKVDDLLSQIKGGADFAEVAKKNSEDVGSSEQGGELEPFAKGEMVEEFSNAAFATPVGSVSDPVRSSFGWHIIKVESKTGKIDKKFSDWLSDLRKNSLIKKL